MGTRKDINKVTVIFEGGSEIELKLFQSPRGLRQEGNRPEKLKINILDEFDVKGVVNLLEYLSTLYFSMKT